MFKLEKKGKILHVDGEIDVNTFGDIALMVNLPDDFLIEEDDENEDRFIITLNHEQIEILRDGGDMIITKDDAEVLRVRECDNIFYALFTYLYGEVDNAVSADDLYLIHTGVVARIYGLVVQSLLNDIYSSYDTVSFSVENGEINVDDDEAWNDVIESDGEARLAVEALKPLNGVSGEVGIGIVNGKYVLDFMELQAGDVCVSIDRRDHDWAMFIDVVRDGVNYNEELVFTNITGAIARFADIAGYL